MAKYRKKPIVVEAHQWFRNGDHPDDKYLGPQYPAVEGEREGRLVRYFRRPDVPDGQVCEKCNHCFFAHGWVDTFEGGHIVCPGDWVITGIKGEHYPCKPDIFEMTYEPVGEKEAT